VSLGPLRTKGVTSSKPGVAQLGTHRAIDPKLLQKGKWDQNTWKLMVQSPEAQGLRLHVTGMDLGGGKLVVRGTDGEAQTFKGKGPNGNGDFWTGLIRGDSALLEFQGPRKRSLPFHIPELSHLWTLPF
jgi:hypothetical protein